MKLDHVAMYVKDLEGTKNFFIKYFHAKANAMYHNKKRDFKSYFLSFEDGARLEIMHLPEMEDGKKGLTRTGFIHIAFSLGSKEGVDLLTSQLKEDGFEIVSGPRVTGDGYYESCFIDLEGNQIEITE